MESTPPVLHVLLIEDDPDNLELLVETLETEIAGHSLRWDPCDDIDDCGPGNTCQEGQCRAITGSVQSCYN